MTQLLCTWSLLRWILDWHCESDFGELLAVVRQITRCRFWGFIGLSLTQLRRLATTEVSVSRSARSLNWYLGRLGFTVSRSCHPGAKWHGNRAKVDNLAIARGRFTSALHVTTGRLVRVGAPYSWLLCVKTSSGPLHCGRQVNYQQKVRPA